MKYRTRIYYTEEQKSQMWDRWQKGESLHAIARLFLSEKTSLEVFQPDYPCEPLLPN